MMKYQIYIKLDNSKLGSTQQWMTLTCCQDHILAENIWFIWSETSYSGDERRCYRCGTNNRTNTEDRATQPMEAGGWVSQKHCCPKLSRIPSSLPPYKCHQTCTFLTNASMQLLYKSIDKFIYPHTPSLVSSLNFRLKKFLTGLQKGIFIWQKLRLLGSWGFYSPHAKEMEPSQ